MHNLHVEKAKAAKVVGHIHTWYVMGRGVYANRQRDTMGGVDKGEHAAAIKSAVQP